MNQEVTNGLLIVAIFLSVLSLGLHFHNASAEVDLTHIENRIDDLESDVLVNIEGIREISQLWATEIIDIDNRYTELRNDVNRLDDIDEDDLDRDLDRLHDQIDEIEDCLEDSNNLTEIQECI